MILPGRILLGIVISGTMTGCAADKNSSSNRTTLPSLPVQVHADSSGFDERATTTLGAVIKYDRQLRSFAIRNSSGRTVWFDGYGAAAPLIFVERLTRDGWVETNHDWCGTGVQRHRLEPNKSITLAPRLKAMDYNPRTDMVIKDKYPDIDHFAVRVGIEVFESERDDHGVMVWSDKVESVGQ